MKKFKLREVFWGIALVAVAIFLVMNQLHLFAFHLKISMIIWTIIFGAALIESLADRSLFGTTFSIAFLLIVYAEPLHITKIVPWTVLIAAFLIYLGLSLIFKRSWFPKTVYFNQKKRQDFKNNHSRADNNVLNASNSEADGEDIVINQRLSSVSRYISSKNLRSITINSSLGEVEVYLDQAEAAGDTVVADINGTMGEIEFYLPSSWKVDSQNLNVALGELEIEGESTGGGPTLVLTGHSNMGEIEVYYV